MEDEYDDYGENIVEDMTTDYNDHTSHYNKEDFRLIVVERYCVV